MLLKKLPRGLRSTTPARVGGGSVPLRSAPFRSVTAPFRYAMAARVLRYVPRARTNNGRYLCNQQVMADNSQIITNFAYQTLRTYQ